MKFYNYQPTLKCPICGLEYAHGNQIAIPGRHIIQAQCDSCENYFELAIDISINYSAWEIKYKQP
jgi:transcription elongation factor Elf1